MTAARRLSTLLLLLLALTWLLPSQAALAHASLVRSVPADGASVEEAPGEVFLWFDEAVRLGFSRFDVRDPTGRVVPVRAVRASGGSPGLVTLELPPLERGVYTVTWAVLSEIDTHVTEGIVLFGVAEPVSSGAVAARADTPIQPVDVGLRWLDLLLLAGLIGALVVCRFVLEIRPEPGEAALALLRSAARRRVLGLAVSCGLLSLAIGIGLFLWQAEQVSDVLGGGTTWFDVGPRLLFEGRWARLWWLREVLLAALTGFSWFFWRTSRRQTTEHVPGSLEEDGFPAWAWRCTGALAVVLALVVASSGHAATVDQAPAAVAADALHLLGASAWVGGLIALAVGLLPLLRRRRDLFALTRGSWRPFSRIAALSLGVLAATGLYSAGQQVASVDALVLTSYGKALMTKVGIVAAAAAIGALNAVLLRPSLAAPLARLLRRPVGWTPVSPKHFHRLAVAEVALGVVVFGAVGVISSTAPARGPEFRPVTNIPSSLSEQVGDLLLTVTVKPNLPGTNVVLVDAVSTRRPPPAQVASVVLSVEGANGQTLSMPLDSAGPDAFQASVSVLDRGGPWDLSIDAQRPGLPGTAASFEWNVRDRTTVRSEVISDRPLGPVLTTAAVAVGLIVLGTAVGMWLRRRTPRPGGTGAPHGASAAPLPEASLSHGGSDHEELIVAAAPRAGVILLATVVCAWLVRHRFPRSVRARVEESARAKASLSQGGSG